MTEEQRRYREALYALDAAYKAARADLVRRMDEACTGGRHYQKESMKLMLRQPEFELSPGMGKTSTTLATAERYGVYVPKEDELAMNEEGTA